MSWWIGILGLAAAGVGGIIALARRRSRRRQYETALQVWRRSTIADQESAMQAFLADTPINGPASYLLACAHLRDGRTREAAREFGAAYHADCNLESAALLTFACLKSREGPDTDITEQIEKTWHEMKRPDLLEHWEDRAMLLTLSTLSLDAAQHKAPGKFLGLCLDALKKCEPNQARSGPLASSSDSRDPFR